MSRCLKAQESIVIQVDAQKEINNSGIEFCIHKEYRIEVLSYGPWRHGIFSTNPQGYDSLFYWPLKNFLRYKQGKFLELVGFLGKEEKDFFSIGFILESFTPSFTGNLYLFANDIPYTYWKNKGKLYLKITRLS